MALRSLSVNSSAAIYVGDHLVDAEAAQRAEVGVVAVPLVWVPSGSMRATCAEAGREAALIANTKATTMTTTIPAERSFCIESLIRDP